MTDCGKKTKRQNALSLTLGVLLAGSAALEMSPTAQAEGLSEKDAETAANMQGPEERTEKLTLVPASADRPALQPVWKTKTVGEWAAVLETAVPEPSIETDARSIPTIREQWYAAYALGEYGQEALSAVPVLLKRFAHEAGKDDDVRACILYSLGKMQAEDAFPILLEALESDYPLIARTAALALGRYPERLASPNGKEAVKRMLGLLRESSDLQIPLVANCAVTLWGAGEKTAVCEWLISALNSERKDAFTRNFEIYQGCSVCLQLTERFGKEDVRTSFESWTETGPKEPLPKNSLPEILAELAKSGSDLDVKLIACETLASLGSWVLPAVQKSMGDPEKTDEIADRLLYVLAQIDGGSAETAKLLFRIVSEESAPLRVRTAAVRGLVFLSKEKQKTAAELLVKLLNAAEVSDVLAMEARFMLDRLTQSSGT